MTRGAIDAAVFELNARHPPPCHPGLDPGSRQLFVADKIPDRVRDDREPGMTN